MNLGISGGRNLNAHVAGSLMSGGRRNNAVGHVGGDSACGWSSGGRSHDGERRGVPGREKAVRSSWKAGSSCEGKPVIKSKSISRSEARSD
jgi:hypothetical protein